MSTRILDPFGALSGLQRALDASKRGDWLNPSTSSRGGFPLIDVFRRGDDYVVMCELPGVAKSSLELEIHRNRLRVAGVRHIDYGDGISLHRVERRSGGFDRTVTLPVQVDPESAKASFDDGVLTIELPRLEQDKPKRIDVG